MIAYFLFAQLLKDRYIKNNSQHGSDRYFHSIYQQFNIIAVIYVMSHPKCTYDSRLKTRVFDFDIWRIFCIFAD